MLSQIWSNWIIGECELIYKHIEHWAYHRKLTKNKLFFEVIRTLKGSWGETHLSALCHLRILRLLTWATRKNLYTTNSWDFSFQVPIFSGLIALFNMFIDMWQCSDSVRTYVCLLKKYIAMIRADTFLSLHFHTNYIENSCLYKRL